MVEFDEIALPHANYDNSLCQRGGLTLDGGSVHAALMLPGEPNELILADHG